MYCALPYAKPELENLENFLRQQYSLSQSFQSHDQDLASCKKVYEDLWANLSENQQKKTLVVHAFTGHAAMLNGLQALLVNEINAQSRFYERLPVEELVTATASKFPNSYNIAVFSCYREPFKTQYALFTDANPYVDDSEMRERQSEWDDEQAGSIAQRSRDSITQ